MKDNQIPNAGDKVLLAQNVVKKLEKEMLGTRFDLDSEIINIVNQIRKWNN